MILSETQHDALVELINIAFGRAAASLSELTGHRVELDVPQVSVVPVSELSAALGGLIRGEVTSVHQIFSGPVAGDALLLLDYQGALNLVSLLTEEPPGERHLGAAEREVLTEVGNILLNACLGTFGNLLRVHISFAVPRLQLDSLEGLLDTLVIESTELRYALVVFTDFHLRDQKVGGYLMIVLGVASLDLLIQSIEGQG